MSKKETRSQLIQELEDCSRNEVGAVLTVINNKSKYQLPTYGTKEQLLQGLRGIDPCVLEDAMDAVLPTEEYEDEADKSADDTEDFEDEGSDADEDED